MWYRYRSKIIHLINSKYTVSSEYRSKYFEDLLQAGQISLFKAYQSFDNTKSSNRSIDVFWSYARKRVEGGLKDELSRNIGLVYAPRRIKVLANKVSKLTPDMDRLQIAFEVGCTLEEVYEAEVYLRLKDTISLDQKFNGSNGDQELSLIDYISDSDDQFNDIMISEFLETLDSKEKILFERLLNGNYTLEIVDKLRCKDERVEQLIVSIQAKLINYLNQDNYLEEESDMSVKKSNARPITQNEFRELVKQGVPINEIARRYRMSPVTLRKHRNEWETTVKEEVDQKYENENLLKETVSSEEYQKLLSDYQNLKMEHGFLWQYLKQLLSRMDTPFSLNQE